MAAPSPAPALIFLRVAGIPDDLASMAGTPDAGSPCECIEVDGLDRRGAGADRIAAHLVSLAGDRVTTVVAVGLAATMLLGIAAFAPPSFRFVAMFPYLGVDAPIYQRRVGNTEWPDRWLRFARWPFVGSIASRVAVAPAPLGLEDVHAPASVSWRQAARVMDRSGFAALVIPVACPTLLVLNARASRLDRDRARLQIPAMNALATTMVADPYEPGLLERAMRRLDDHARAHGVTEVSA